MKFSEKIDLQTQYGEFEMLAYESDFKSFPTIVLRKHYQGIPLVRLHSECMTGDLFSSMHCDCGEQLNYSLKQIQENGGIVIYLRQEGRGIGLLNKMKAYKLQSVGYDTVQANLALGFESDSREYDDAAKILHGLGVNKLRLLTNNPLKVEKLVEQGIEVVNCESIEVGYNKHNATYMLAKKQKMNHVLKLNDSEKISLTKPTLQAIDS